MKDWRMMPVHKKPKMYELDNSIENFFFFLLQEKNLQTLNNVNSLFYDVCRKPSLASSRSTKVQSFPLWREGEKEP